MSTFILAKKFEIYSGVGEVERGKKMAEFVDKHYTVVHDPTGNLADYSCKYCKKCYPQKSRGDLGLMKNHLL